MVLALLKIQSMVARILYDFDTKFTWDKLKTVNIEKVIVIPDDFSESGTDNNNNIIIIIEYFLRITLQYKVLLSTGSC